ncbi:MAG: hypothetical protein H6888_06650 [Nitratireductor sp.]|nr:hypothetical protein [Nitratireductor sp.]MCC0020741.1 hypothetical protein [Nitratireductor sp.]
MIRFLATLTKIAIASLLVGVVLDKFDISANEILLKAGLTQENVVEYAQMALAWATPNIILGSLVIVPVWLVTYLFRPPRG